MSRLHQNSFVRCQVLNLCLIPRTIWKHDGCWENNLILKEVFIIYLKLSWPVIQNWGLELSKNIIFFSMKKLVIHYKYFLMILIQICLINLLKGRHVGWNPFKLLSWLALNTIPKFDVKVYTCFCSINAVFKFIFSQYNKKYYPGDVRCCSAMNKAWSECSSEIVFIRWDSLLYQNVRKAMHGLYKRFSLIELKCKVHTMVLF